MPAITLGVAEVEARLQALRRRLNAVTAQQGAYIGVSAVLLILTALIVLGLRAPADAFRIATWTGVLIALVVVAVCIGVLRRRWLDLNTTARLADHQGRLNDRLLTLIDLRARPRASRLAPVLVGQTLALGAQWHLQRLAPRRVSRWIFLLIASLLALGSTAFMARRDAAQAQSGSAQMAGDMSGGGGAALTNAAPTDGAGGSGSDQGGADAGAMGANGAPSDSAQRGNEQAKPSQHGGVQHAGAAAPEAQAEGNEPQLSNSGLAKLPDRLQQAIRRAFNAEQMDQPQQLAARSKDGGSESGEHGDTDREHRDPSGRSAAEKNNAASQNPQAKAQGAQNAKSGKQPEQPQPGQQNEPRQDGTDQKFDGASPQAGNGSSPGGLMGGHATEVAAAGEAPKTFKLTITSFLRAMEQRGNQLRKPGKRVSTTGAGAVDAPAERPLNERQLNDDSLRKAEIPFEYEDLVRRVYSARADE